MTSKERIIEMIREEFGLKDGVKFNLVDENGDKRGWAPFYFENNQLRGAHRSPIHEDIFLNWDNIEVIKEPLLTDEEKEFLEIFLKFLEKDVATLEKKLSPFGSHLRFWNYGELVCATPIFKDKFQSLEEGLEYTLEELGLED